MSTEDYELEAEIVNIEDAENLIREMRALMPKYRDLEALKDMITTLQNLQNDEITNDAISDALTQLILLRDEAGLAQR